MSKTYISVERYTREGTDVCSMNITRNKRLFVAVGKNGTHEGNYSEAEVTDLELRGEASVLVERPKPFPTADIALIPRNEGDKWLMFGGDIIHSSDSRFPYDYPVKLHDRFEG